MNKQVYVKVECVNLMLTELKKHVTSEKLELFQALAQASLMEVPNEGASGQVAE